MTNQYHLKITTIVQEDPKNVALEFNSNRASEYEVVETEIKCKGATALARHLRAIAEELDPLPAKGTLRTFNDGGHVTPRLIKDNPQA